MWHPYYCSWVINKLEACPSDKIMNYTRVIIKNKRSFAQHKFSIVIITDLSLVKWLLALTAKCSGLTLLKLCMTPNSTRLSCKDLRSPDNNKVTAVSTVCITWSACFLRLSFSSEIASSLKGKRLFRWGAISNNL